MFDLQRALKLKVGQRSQELLARAEEKCAKARSFVTDAYQNNNPELVFQAVEAYLESANIYPLHIEPYIGIAYISWKFEKHGEAVKLLNKALEIEPLNPAARNMLNEIKVEIKEGNFNKFVKDISLKPEKPPINLLPAKSKKKGFFSKVLDIFSFGKPDKNKGSINKTPVPDKRQTDVDDLSKEEFLNSVNKIGREITYEKITMKADKNTLNKIAMAVNEKKYYNRAGEQLASAIPSLDLFDNYDDKGNVSIDVNKVLNMRETTRDKLTALQNNRNDEKITVKVDKDKFSILKKQV
jgi:tetratricopeptide (TPR) repeat protein